MGVVGTFRFKEYQINLIMRSQNSYQLSFNPRGPGKKNRAQKNRIIPQLKQNQDKYLDSLRNYDKQSQRYHSRKEKELAYTPANKQLRIALNVDQSEYISNSNISGSQRRQEEMRQRHQQKRQQQRQVKQDMIRRVRQLQQKVKPLVSGEGQEYEEDFQAGWQARIDIRLLRIETSINNYRKQWTVEMERRLLELDQQMEKRFKEIIKKGL